MTIAYTALKSVDETEDLEYLERGEEIKATPPQLLIISLAFIVICVFVNLFIPITVPAELYRPNIYIGLDQLNATIQKTSLPEHLTVFPHLFSPVSRVDVNKVYPNDGNARITFNGLVSPGEPHVIINQNISMIAQHRVKDYGLNRCFMVSTMPDASLLGVQNRTLTLKSEQFAVDVWLLDSHENINPKTLSWSTRPSRKVKIANLVVRRGAETYSEEFYCGESGSTRIYEFACQEGSMACEVEFMQGQPEIKPRMAITIEQRPSIP